MDQLEARTMNEEVILDTDPRAATYRTDIKGWVSRKGHFYGDGAPNERVARYDGSTHHKCEGCDAIVPHPYRRCGDCRARHKHEQWLALELVKWDGETPLALFQEDEYFFDAESIYNYAEAHDLNVGELDLVVCAPRAAHNIDESDWADDLPEDEEIPGWLADAIDKFNSVIFQHRNEPLSWFPANHRVVLPDEQEEDKQ